LRWLVNDPTALAVLAACALLGVATHAVGADALASSVASAPRPVDSAISLVFGSPRSFARAVEASWYLVVAAHLVEGAYVFKQCRGVLKTTIPTAVRWFALTSCVGWPITRRVVELARVDKESRVKRS